MVPVPRVDDSVTAAARSAATGPGRIRAERRTALPRTLFPMYPAPVECQRTRGAPRRIPAGAAATWRASTQPAARRIREAGPSLGPALRPAARRETPGEAVPCAGTTEPAEPRTRTGS